MRLWKSLPLKGMTVWKLTHSTDSVDSPVESTFSGPVDPVCVASGAPASFAASGVALEHPPSPIAPSPPASVIPRLRASGPRNGLRMSRSRSPTQGRLPASSCRHSGPRTGP